MSKFKGPDKRRARREHRKLARYWLATGMAGEARQHLKQARNLGR